MGRVFQHLLTEATFLAVAAGGGIAIVPGLLASRQITLPSSDPLVAIQINGNILGTIAANVSVGVYTPPLIDTLSALGTNANSFGVASTSLIGGILGGVGGLLNIPLQTISNVLTPALAPLLTNAPIQVLDGLLDAALYPHPLDPKVNGWQYWGCFYSNDYLSARSPTDFNAIMSPQRCIAKCTASGNEFAVVRANACYCSDDAPASDHGSSHCDHICPTVPLDSNLFCGGLGILENAAMSVFRRAIMSNPEALPVIPEPAGWRYSGCFFGDAWRLTVGFSRNFPSPSPINAAICTSTCTTGGLSFRYAALFKTICYCSNNAPLTSSQAGIGQCTSAICTGRPGESCGGLSNYAPYSLNSFSSMITLYVQAPPIVTTPVRTIDDPVSQSWTYWGCYYGALYLLDTIFTGTQVNSLHDPTPFMSAENCIARCIGSNSNPAYNYALTLGGACFCTDKAPTEDIFSDDQARCNEPCLGNIGERCGGYDLVSLPALGRSLINVYGRTKKMISMPSITTSGTFNMVSMSEPWA